MRQRRITMAEVKKQAADLKAENRQKALETALQQIYDYDLYLFDLADTVKGSVDSVEDAVAAGDGIDTAVKELNKVAQECLVALNRRAEVKFGTQNS